MRLEDRCPVVATILAAFAVGTAGCAGGEPVRPGGTADTATADRAGPLGAPWKQTREGVIRGVRSDFQVAVEGPSGFAHCFISRFRRRLTAERLAELAAVHATEGEPAAARALNGLGVGDGDACGGRRWVPQLIDGAMGLRADRREGRSADNRVQTAALPVSVGSRVTLMGFAGVGRFEVSCRDRPRVAFRVGDKTAAVGVDTGRRRGRVQTLDPGRRLQTRLSHSALQRWHVASSHGDGVRVVTASVAVTPVRGGQGACLFSAQSTRSGPIP